MALRKPSGSSRPRSRRRNHPAVGKVALEVKSLQVRTPSECESVILVAHQWRAAHTDDLSRLVAERCDLTFFQSPLVFFGLHFFEIAKVDGCPAGWRLFLWCATATA